jgi:hypothetical protein
MASDSSNFASSFACGRIAYAKYGAVAEEFKKFSDADQVAAMDNKPEATPEAKATYDRLIKEADAVLDCWGRYLAHTAGQTNGTRSQVEAAVKGLYEYRYKSMDGYDKFIEQLKSGTAATAAPAKPPSN